MWFIHSSTDPITIIDAKNRASWILSWFKGTKGIQIIPNIQRRKEGLENMSNLHCLSNNLFNRRNCIGNKNMLTKQRMLTCIWTPRLNLGLPNSHHVEIIICLIFGTPPSILIDKSYVDIFCLNPIINLQK